MAHLQGLLDKNKRPPGTPTHFKTTKKHRSVSKVLTATKRYLSSRIEELKDSLSSENEKEPIEKALKLLTETVTSLSTSISDCATLLLSSENTTAESSSTTNNASNDWQFNRNIAEPLSPDKLSQINWKECIGVQRSDTGTDGVLFAMFNDNKAACIKAPGSIAAEVYGSWLAKRIGVPTPAMRLVDRNGEEGQKIISVLLSPSLCTTPTKRSRIERVVLRPFFIIMEFVPGIPLEDIFQPISTTFIKEKFSTCNTTIEQKQFHEIGALNLMIFGKILALDILTNNFDRLPCIWENNGNPGNIMFRTEPKHTALCIDNMVSCIDVEKFDKQYQQYVEKATNLLRRLLPPDISNDNDVSSIDTTLKEFERVRTFLNDGTGNGGWPGLGYDIGINGMHEIQQGFFKCMLAFASVPRLEFINVKDALHEAMKDSLTEHNTWGLERIHPKFIFKIADALNDVADHSKELGSSNINEDDTNVNGTVSEMTIIPPDSALMPEKNDREHRKLISRQTQQENVALLNRILSSSETHVTDSFVPINETEMLNSNGGNKDEPPKTPTRLPTKTRRGEYESIASPALLRKLEGRGQTSEVCVVM
jgi:hypothetical protein